MPLKISQSRLNCPTIAHAKPTLASGPACAGSIIQCFGAKRARYTRRGHVIYIYIDIDKYLNECFHMFRSTYDSKKQKIKNSRTA